MRKYILFILLSCLAARGQTIIDLADIDLSGLPQPTQAKALRYWFDDDATTVQTSNLLSGKYSLDVSGMMEGVHTLHYQVIDNENVVAHIGSGLFLKAVHSTNLSGKSMRYWFDDDATTVQTASGTTGNYMLDVNSLIDGLHTIHYQLVDESGVVGYVGSSLFLNIGSSSGTGIVKPQKLMYWFDDETAINQVNIGEGIHMIDASALIEGLHTLHYQVLCTNGQMTPAMSTLFLRVSADAGTAVAKSLLYWFDDGQEASETEVTEGIKLLDASALTEGLHTIHYQIMDSKGKLGAPASSMFLKMDAFASSVAESIRYWFDDDATTTKVIGVANGTQTLDVSDLLTGLHTLNYQVIDNNGKVSVPVTRLFMKNFDKVLADGNNRVTKYQYWLNTNSQAMQTVELSNAVNPYQLISLLPMQKEPIHSDCFQFEITNDVPTVYAKNIFHVRFYDAQDYFSDGQKPFVDYRVKQKVKTIGELQSTQTFEKVADNAIRWYTMQAAPGDTAAFRLSQPATLQVFAPSGKEVFNTSESASVNWSGIHTWENGTYYVAVHDVTGSNPEMTLECFHVGKYAILSHSPEEVGVKEGNFYMQIFGNGYDKLVKAQLVNDNDVLTADLIQIQDICNATLQFSFADDNYPRGEYDLVLEFTDGHETESFSIVDAVTIADPIFGDITIDVISHPTVAMPYPVIVKIKNTGNVTYQFVPLYFSNSINQLQSVHLLNFGLQSSKNVIDAGIKTFYEVNNLFGEESCIVIPTIIPVLNPYQSAEYQIGFITGPNAHFNMYVWTETPWSMRDSNSQRARRMGPRMEPVTNVTCEMDPCELVSLIPNSSCICNVLWGGVSAISNAYGAVNQWRNNQLRSIYGQWYEDNGMDWPYRDIPLRTPADIIDQVIRECLGELAPEEIARVQGSIEAALNMMRDRDPQECPQPHPNPINPYMPGDPNDIIGYMAESGSKFMKKGTTDVYYTIEFENDPEIANASAHTIVVTDTLDTSRFDLSTFAAKSIKLGNKETVQLNGVKSIDRMSIDLRPEINVIAQFSLSLNEQKGIAQWKIESLDPMTMEPTNDAIQGVIPVNVNGNGQGELSFDIKLIPGLAEGETVSNRVGIIFDQEKTIMTPTWKNIVDGTAPESHVSDVQMATDTTAAVRIEASDKLSGPWRYNVYVQYGSGAWFLGAENVPIDSVARVKVYEGIDHGFYTVVTDSAGNVEQKEAAREFSFEVFAPQVDTNTKIELAQGWNWISHNQQEVLSPEALKPKAQRIVSQTDELFKDSRFGWTGDLDELLPTELYKVQMTEADDVQLSGKLFNSTFRSVPLYEGWNWMGYPVAMTMTPAEALQKMEAEEGDFIIGQDGMTTFTEGQWTGTLSEMLPGQGYMYRSVSNKNLFLNATAQSSSRKANVHRSVVNVQYPDGWTVDKRKYPNVMGLVADLLQDGETLDANEWIVAAFSGEECRGLSQVVNGHQMMNVYGQGGEPIVFMALNRESGEVVAVEESESFRTDILGTMQQPYELHSGVANGIAELEEGRLKIENSVYDLQGRRVEKSSVGNGIYIVTDGSKTQKYVNHKRNK